MNQTKGLIINGRYGIREVISAYAIHFPLYFANAIVGEDVAEVGDGLESITAEVSAYPFTHNDIEMRVVDTPGFDEFMATQSISDLDILQKIAEFMKREYVTSNPRIRLKPQTQRHKLARLILRLEESQDLVKCLLEEKEQQAQEIVKYVQEVERLNDVIKEFQFPNFLGTPPFSPPYPAMSSTSGDSYYANHDSPIIGPRAIAAPGMHASRSATLPLSPSPGMPVPELRMPTPTHYTASDEKVYSPDEPHGTRRHERRGSRY
ncbi:hypothetical protein CC2G_002375 [Coprinopsis cinerea AmutBmut pab1-1]|nr:hypothetical protein CC2G_002375 [Coprinopsis cinerea AmutBmut pab1-1]